VTAIADPFVAMAKRIEAIDPKEFAGAVVIVPPEGGPAVEFMLNDPQPNAAAFWAIAKTRVEVRVAEVVDEEERRRQQAQPYGGRR
jgi:hypothetical protein